MLQKLKDTFGIKSTKKETPNEKNADFFSKEEELFLKLAIQASLAEECQEKEFPAHTRIGASGDEDLALALKLQQDEELGALANAYAPVAEPKNDRSLYRFLSQGLENTPGGFIPLPAGGGWLDGTIPGFSADDDIVSPRSTIDDEEFARNLQKQESGTASIPQAKIQPAFRKKPEPDTSHDEELARKLFEEENKPPSSSQQGLPGLIPAVNDFLGLSICKGCNQPLSYGQFYQTGTGKYHTSCFICQACGQIISSPTFRIQNDLLYHPQCAMELFSPRCVVCELPIAANSQGQITFIKHPFFDEKSCAHHKSSCARCCACMRFEPQAPSKAFSQLADGRKLCMACCRTVVLDSDEAQPIFHRILAWFEAELGLRIPEEMRQVPVLLVDELTLNEKSSRCGHESVAGVPTTRGLTLSEEGTIQHMGPGVLIFDPYTGQIRQGPMQVYKMGRVKSVTAILVLGGLPYDLCSSVLAHECFHAWLRTQIDFPNLPSQVEEGMCQLIAHLWLTHNKQNLMQRKSSYGKLLDGPTDEALRNLFLYQIETNDSEVYGDGFRFAAQAYASLGLEILIAHLKTHQAFPVT